MATKLNTYWHYGLVAGAFGVAASAFVAPLPAQAASQTQLTYTGEVTIIGAVTFPGVPLPLPISATVDDIDQSLVVDDLENRLSDGSLTPPVSLLENLLRELALAAIGPGNPLLTELVDNATLASLSGTGEIFDVDSNLLSEFDFSYGGGPILVIDDYEVNQLGSCLIGTCLIQGSGRGVLTSSISSGEVSLGFELDFDLTQTATLPDPDPDPDPDPGVGDDPDDSVAVPEPTSILGMLAIATGGLVLKRRRSQS